MKGWPKPNEVDRQAWIATNALTLADSHRFLTIGYILDQVRDRLRDERATTAEEGLLQLFQLYERPAPAGQQHLIIKEGALVAPGGN